MTDSSAPPSSTAGAQAPDVDPNRWRVLTVCLVTGFMTLLDVSIVNVALPSIAQGLGASGSELQWVVTGYAVVFGLALVPAGRLGDSFGRKKIFLVGLVLFTLGSLACGLAPDPGTLIAARIFQGLGAGILNPQITAIINSEFRGAERGKAFGRFGAVVGLSTAVGPLLGGLLITLVPWDESWRLVFLVNLPVAVVAFALGLKLISDRSSAERTRLDWVGTVLLAIAVGLVLGAVQERSVLGPALVVGALVVAVAAFWGFAAWERRYAAAGHLPLARPGLLKTPGFGPGVLVGGLFFGGFIAIFFTVTLYLQDSLGYSALEAGLTQSPFALASAVAAPWAGKRVAAQGRTLIVRGLGMVVVGLLLVIGVVELVAPAVGDAWTGLLLVAPFLLTGFGSGTVIGPNVNLSLANIDPRDAGSASGVFQTFQRVGSGIGLAVVSAVFLAVSDAGDPRDALSIALGASALLVLAALVVAVWDVRHGNPADGSSDQPSHRSSGRPPGRGAHEGADDGTRSSAG